MKSFTTVFRIVEDNNCPLYEVGECFTLTDRSFACPGNKEVCLILVREMTELLFVLMGAQEGSADSEPTTVHSCSGCTGLIKFQTIPEEEEATPKEEQEVPLDSREQKLLGRIIDCPLFRTVPPSFLREMLGYFREISIPEGRSLIRKGEVNEDLYVLLDGKLAVEDGPVYVTTLVPGEICGEMSYFADQVAGASVRAVSNSVVLAIAGEYFGRIIEQSPAAQHFMARLLAERLAGANSARARDFDSCMQGRLKEMAPAELFQILHMHQKTGVLSLRFGNRNAEVAFREGCIINAVFGELRNQEAIYEILAEKEGIYTFRVGLRPEQMKAAEIGDFMMLLMEGVKRVDEEHDVQ